MPIPSRPQLFSQRFAAGGGNPVENEDVYHKDSQNYCSNCPLNSCGNYPDTGGDLLVSDFTYLEMKQSLQGS
jgi:hypothetical protein